MATCPRITVGSAWLGANWLSCTKDEGHEGDCNFVDVDGEPWPDKGMDPSELPKDSDYFKSEES